VPVEEFIANLEKMVNLVLEQTSATPILIAGCLPNPKWQHTSGLANAYADAIRTLGDRIGVAVSDVNQLWNEELRAGKTPESLLLNNINHPNDYGHSIYAQAFQQLFIKWL